MSPPNPPRSRWWGDPLALVEVFVVGNLAFLALDIYIAHAINDFANPAEWIPFAYSLAAPAALLVAMALGGVRPSLGGPDETPRRRLARGIGLAVGWAGLAVGIAGMLLHLESQFFREQSLKNLVYTAPFAAPLAYAGLGFLILLDRMVDSRTLEWARWLALLTLGGFAGNFVLSLADHAQNGFFHTTEWVGVFAAALAVGALLAVLMFPGDRASFVFCAWVMAAQVPVGLLGFVFHVRANLAKPEGTLWEKFLYGAPAFAPLLFANMALLAALTLWAIRRAVPSAEGRQPSPEPLPAS